MQIISFLFFMFLSIFVFFIISALFKKIKPVYNGDKLSYLIFILAQIILDLTCILAIITKINQLYQMSNIFVVLLYLVICVVLSDYLVSKLSKIVQEQFMKAKRSNKLSGCQTEPNREFVVSITPKEFNYKFTAQSWEIAESIEKEVKKYLTSEISGQLKSSKVRMQTPFKIDTNISCINDRIISSKNYDLYVRVNPFALICSERNIDNAIKEADLLCKKALDYYGIEYSYDVTLKQKETGIVSKPVKKDPENVERNNK